MSVQLPGLPDQLENEEVLRIFREIDKSPETTQRELSSRLGISLGKVNFLINAMIEKGFLKVENFRKSSSKSAYIYYLTPMGIEKKPGRHISFSRRRSGSTNGWRRRYSSCGKRCGRAAFLPRNRTKAATGYNGYVI